jgi:hypothetical protein
VAISATGTGTALEREIALLCERLADKDSVIDDLRRRLDKARSRPAADPRDNPSQRLSVAPRHSKTTFALRDS